MRQAVIEKFAGTILILGGLLGVFAHVIHPDAPDTAQAIHSYVSATVRAHLLLGSAVLLVCMGLPFLCERLSRRNGFAALLAYPLLFVGLMSSEFLHCPVEIALFPELEQLGHGQMTAVISHLFSDASVFQRIQSISVPLLIAGVFSLLFSASTTKVPRWPAVFLIGFLGFLAATFVPFLHRIPAGHLFPINLYLAFASYGAVLIQVPELAGTQNQVPDETTAELRPA